MPIDFSAFKTMDLSADAVAGFQSAVDRRGAVVRLREGAPAPAYVNLAKTAGNIYTTRLNADQWTRLKADPAVADVKLSTTERLIE